MRNLLTILLLFIGFSVSYAQPSKIVSCHNYLKRGNLKKAHKVIEEAVTSGKTKEKDMAKAWYYRGKTYHAIFQSKEEKYQKLDADPLGKAVESYQKSLACDKKNKYTKDNIHNLKVAVSQYFNLAIDFYNKENYPRAISSFEAVLKLNEVKEIARLDTQVIYNLALAANKAKDNEKAIIYFEKCLNYKYGGISIYYTLINLYQEKKETEKRLTLIKKGIDDYPNENSQLILLLVNHYLETKQTTEALAYLKIAIEKDGKNASLYFAQGTLFDELKQYEDALKSYNKATELKPDYFDAWYNIGALYNNKAADAIKKSNDSEEDADYQKYKEEADEAFNLALEPLEKAYALNSEDKNTLISLKQIYYKLQMMDKYKEIDAKLKK